jgi:hypothetical protein
LQNIFPEIFGSKMRHRHCQPPGVFHKSFYLVCLQNNLCKLPDGPL